MTGKMDKKQSRRLAIGILAGAVIALLTITAGPVWLANASRQAALDEAHERLQRYQQIAARDKELLPQYQALLQKQAAQGLTPEEEELLQALEVTIETRRNAGLTDIRNAAAPAEEAANEIIRELAARDGLALVLDLDQAAGLVVFAATSVPDITEEAVVLMQERYPAE